MPRRSPLAPRSALLAAGLLAAAAAACRDLPFQPQDPRTVTFAPALGINLSQFTQLPSGVYIRDLAVGSGTVVESTSTIGITYRGFLANGIPFDTSAASNPVINPIGIYVPGFRNGLLGARQGSRRQLIIPPSQAYGNRTTPTNRIPAGSVLFFDVNITSVVTPVDTTRRTTARAAR